MRALISIIIPVYNAESTLERCVDSIMNQTYRKFEILLIDDGSTDRSAAICDWYTSKYPNVRCLHKVNRGVSDARNRGLEMSIGKYVTFCDSDDFVEKDWLQNFTAKISDNSQLYVQGFMEKKNGEIGSEFGVNGVLCCREAEAVMGKQNLYAFVWNKLFELDIIRKNRLQFNVNICALEDQIFVKSYICCPEVREITLISNKGYIYNLNDDFKNKYVYGNGLVLIAGYETEIDRQLGEGNKDVAEYVFSLCTDTLFLTYSAKSCDAKKILRKIYDLVKKYNNSSIDMGGRIRRMGAFINRKELLPVTDMVLKCIMPFRK